MDIGNVFYLKMSRAATEAAAPRRTISATTPLQPLNENTARTVTPYDNEAALVSLTKRNRPDWSQPPSYNNKAQLKSTNQSPIIYRDDPQDTNAHDMSSPKTQAAETSNDIPPAPKGSLLNLVA